MENAETNTVRSYHVYIAIVLPPPPTTKKERKKEKKLNKTISNKLN